MNKLRYIYGFLILIILVGGFYIAKISGLFVETTTTNLYELAETTENNGSYEVIEGKGLPFPRGTYTLSDIMKAYNIGKVELYEALDLSSDIPESSKVIDLIQDGLLKSKTVQGYMTPITLELDFAD